MTQIMEPEAVETGPSTCLLPCMVIDTTDRRSLVVEDVALPLRLLLRQDSQRISIKRHRNHLPRLGLVGMNPRDSALQVDLRPLQQPNVGFSQPGRQSEARHLAKMKWQLREQPLRLWARQPGQASVALGQLPNRRHRINPALRVTVVEHDGQRSHVPIHGGAGNPVF
ncbi:hypothetical protein BL243_07800 [Ralstonia solanacearum]|nr:hypothetical protein BL243_07800 [Ralstonia solanacearum]